MDDRAELESVRTPITFDYNLPKKKSKSKLIFLILGIVIIAAAGLFFFNKEDVKNIATGAVQTPTPAPTEAPTPAPKPVLVRSDWTFEVLNGSGKSGFAKSIASGLKDLGYQTVKVGNAKESSAKTQILAKKELLDSINLIIADLKDIIKIATVSGELDEGTASARIIIGKDSL